MRLIGELEPTETRHDAEFNALPHAARRVYLVLWARLPLSGHFDEDVLRGVASFALKGLSPLPALGALVDAGLLMWWPGFGWAPVTIAMRDSGRVFAEAAG